MREINFETGVERRKEDIYREIIGLEQGEELETILVLDAGVAQRKKIGEKSWGPTSYEDESGNFSDSLKFAGYQSKLTSRGNPMLGAGGGKARAIASKELWEAFPNSNIVVDSRFKANEAEDRKDTPPEEHYKVYRDYLLELDIPEEKIEEERDSTTTLEGLVNFLDMIVENNTKNSVIITNDYHFERTQKMLEYLTTEEGIKNNLKYLVAKLPDSYKEKLGVKVDHNKDNEPIISFIGKTFEERIPKLPKLIIAEDVLKHRSKHYEELFNKARETDAYKRRVEIEKNGVKQLIEGTYGKPR